MSDKKSHTFTFRVEGISLDERQVREVSDAISGAAAGALLKIGRAPEKQAFRWGGLDETAGGIWLLENVIQGRAGHITPVDVQPNIAVRQ